MLADYGAEVLKIESGEFHDDSRAFSPLVNNWSGYYEILNRNKKSLLLNLKNADDLNRFYILCKECDIIVENLTPSTKYSLKVDYETVKNINPKLIYASLSGLGQNSDRKYYDIIAQAESGLMSLSGDGSPTKIGPSVVDAFSGMTLAFAISSALYYRERHGVGMAIDVSMLGCSVNLLEQNLIEYSISKRNPSAPGNYDSAISPFGVYNAKDGTIVLAIGNNKIWNVFVSFLKLHTDIPEHLFETNEKRLHNMIELNTIINSVFALFHRKNLLKILSEKGIPSASVSEMSDVYENEWFYQSGALKKISHSKLGECVIPGRAINFSVYADDTYNEAPEIGKRSEL
jgi:CoA:oxalate CoA-transferase